MNCDINISISLKVIIFVALFVETPGEDLGLLMIGGNDGNSTASVDLITCEIQNNT